MNSKKLHSAEFFAKAVFIGMLWTDGLSNMQCGGGIGRQVLVIETQVYLFFARLTFVRDTAPANSGSAQNKTVNKPACSGGHSSSTTTETNDTPLTTVIVRAHRTVNRSVFPIKLRAKTKVDAE